VGGGSSESPFVAATRKSPPSHVAALKELRKFGLAYPGAHLKSPWPDHLDLAVNDKTFAYLSIDGEPFGMSCKLPHSAAVALELPFTEPTGYGLGKSGWVSARFKPSETPPTELLKEWIDESYRAQAPKRLIKLLDSGPSSSSSPAAKPKKASKKVTRRKGAR
jgi:predicted DNA-binding protein (MmcQ/YjbR family)